MRALVIENNQDLQQTLARMVERNLGDVELITADCPSDALERIEELKQQTIEYVIMDFNNRGMQNRTLLRRFKKVLGSLPSKPDFFIIYNPDFAEDGGENSYLSKFRSLIGDNLGDDRLHIVPYEGFPESLNSMKQSNI